ncbi:uncharacterized protein BJX67DRAFT_367938 [Aspergillus lucknowensis]|uniref:Uncharacterized protein n=1 Tax=Aspergillus lucknowensis TaxID=176173 RepID=A0ABR4L8F1_9EURO
MYIIGYFPSFPSLHRRPDPYRSHVANSKSQESAGESLGPPPPSNPALTDLDSGGISPSFPSLHSSASSMLDILDRRSAFATRGFIPHCMTVMVKLAVEDEDESVSQVPSNRRGSSSAAIVAVVRLY